MTQARSLWLVHNEASGSNHREALARMEESCSAFGLHIAYRTCFPADDLPSPAMLDAAGIDLVAVLAGDGTANAVLDALAGWSGEVLLLPGGTMNLIYHRLMGDCGLEAAIGAAARGDLAVREIGMITSPLGTAYAGLLAGPGTSWNSVREAIRRADVAAMAAQARDAFIRTVTEQPLACTDPPLGRSSGYPLLMLQPHDDGISVLAYHAETPGEFVDQVLALARRDFRKGPHDHLGTVPAVTLAGVEHRGFGVLLDGEPAQARDATRFALSTCNVKLLAKRRDD